MLSSVCKPRSKTATAKLPVPLEIRVKALALLQQVNDDDAAAFHQEQDAFKMATNDEDAPDIAYALCVSELLVSCGAADKRKMVPEQRRCHIDLDDMPADGMGAREVNVAFACVFCKSTDTSVRFEQTRSIDEPSTIFVSCNNCGKTSRRN